ncbi:hypothetical protein M2138_001488 [Dysgonomonadaceae bacterium PH5-43]|nr:hypothetical protein [Dysgonomonadaceae bacterium PH5-43]
MKRIVLPILIFASSIQVFAQNSASDLTFKFSGFVRGDIIYNTRENVAALEDLFYLYPKDEKKDALGEDLNSRSALGFYNLSTRAALDIAGVKLFDAAVSAKMEADFAGAGGSGGTSAVLRLRLAYINFAWDKSTLLIGQNWHPMFQNIQPGQITLSTGAPFQPFNRSPQLAYKYKIKDFNLRAATIFQLQNKSTGPSGKSNIYAKNATLPELNFIAEYKNKSINTGVGVNFLSLKPRTESSFNGSSYKVDEYIRSLSYLAFFQYTEDMLSVGVKSIYGQNNTNLNMLGGYGIKSINSVTGECKYTNFNYSTSWFNIAYGKKYKGNLMFGYTKNLGTEDALVEGSSLYGEGLSVDNMHRVAFNFTYNVPHFTVGLEYEFMNVFYGNAGTLNWKDGKYSSTHSVEDHRITGVIRYIF